MSLLIMADPENLDPVDILLDYQLAAMDLGEEDPTSAHPCPCPPPLPPLPGP